MEHLKHNYNTTIFVCILDLIKLIINLISDSKGYPVISKQIEVCLFVCFMLNFNMEKKPILAERDFVNDFI